MGEIRPDLEINFDLIDIDHGALELASIALENSNIFEMHEDPKSYHGGVEGYKNRVAKSTDGRVTARLIDANITSSDELNRIADQVEGYHLVEGYGTHEYMNSVTDPDHSMYFLSGYNFLDNLRSITVLSLIHI